MGIEFNSGLKILVVDDDERARRLMQDVLHYFKGIEKIEFAGNGAEALQQLSKSEFDIVTLDLQMPGETGIDFLVKVNNIAPGIKCVIISAATDEMIEASTRLAKECGVELLGALRKPFNLEQLHSILGLQAA